MDEPNFAAPPTWARSARVGVRFVPVRKQAIIRLTD